MHRLRFAGGASHDAPAAGDPLAQTAEAHIYRRDNVFGSCVSRPSASGALRWASDDAMNIYSTVNREQYGSWLLAAQAVRLTGARAAPAAPAVAVATGVTGATGTGATGRWSLLQEHQLS